MTFQHLKEVQNLQWEFYEANDRILTGDISAAKFALPGLRKMCDGTASQLRALGLVDVYLEPYLAAGGWVGLTTSYSFPDGIKVEGSSVPRRIER